MADALSVNIGSTSDDPRKLSKTVTWIPQPGGTPASINCYITDTCDILYPKLIVKYSGTYLSKNYAKISSWGNRYYYINSIDVIPGGKMLLSLSIDVLMTYADLIKNCPCCVTRNENIGINWVPDNKFPLNTLYTTTKGDSSRFTTPFTKNPKSPWILSVINDNGAVHPTPTP